ACSGPRRWTCPCSAPPAAAGPAAAPLGAHPALARLVLRRYDEALARPAHHRELATA
ncbi:sirohydrochlorin chelatase, partial [Streptomyces sp. NPDC031705]